MKNLNFLSLFLLVFVVFLSGCIRQGGNTALSTGIIIKSFQPDFSEVYPGEPVLLSINVQNVGDSDATNGKAQLMVLNPAEWGPESFRPVNLPSPLAKGIPAQKIPGEEWAYEWTLKAPSINTPQHTYTAGVRVTYDYNTYATATLRFMTSDYIKSLPINEQEKMKQQSGIIYSTCSNAPIRVSFSTGMRPFIISNPDQTFIFQVIVTNVGQGNPRNKDGQLYHLTITKPSIAGMPGISCPALDSGSTDIILPRGSSKTISCTIKPTGVANILEGNVDVNLSYSYFVDASTKITVIQQA